MSVTNVYYIDSGNNRKKIQYDCICDFCDIKFTRDRVRSDKTACSYACRAALTLNSRIDGIKQKAISKKNDFICAANIKHNNFYHYNNINYLNKDTMITIICPTHGEFQQTPKGHLKYGCVSCAGLKKFTRDEIINKFKEKHSNKFDYSKFEYFNLNTLSIIICPEHGEYKQTPQHHLISKTGCKACSGLAEWTNERVTDELLNQNKTFKNIGECQGAKTPLKWECLICQYTWSASPYDTLVSPRPTGCPRCSKREPLTNNLVDERLLKFKITDGRNITRVSNVNEFELKTKT